MVVLFLNLFLYSAYVSLSLGITWAPGSYTHPIIDGGRTIDAVSYGKMTLGVTVGGFPIGYTWNSSIRDYFYAV